jgi:acyl-CoA synthetase (AMP-forming)/AMP-acid ligase II
VPLIPIYKTAGWMLGFKRPFYTVAKNTIQPTISLDTAPFKTSTYNWYLESESSYGSSIHNYIFLEIDDFNRNFTANTFYSKTVNDAYLGNNIMGRITVTSGMNTIVTMDGGNLLFKTREYSGPVRLEKLHIRLIDKYGDPINLEGNDFSFMLEVEQLYSK